MLGNLLNLFLFSFAGLDTAKWGMKSLDAWLDLEDNYGLAGFKKAVDLKKKYPKLKVRKLVDVDNWKTQFWLIWQ